MYCLYCGAENPDNAKVCSHCGARLNDGSAEQDHIEREPAHTQIPGGAQPVIPPHDPYDTYNTYNTNANPVVSDNKMPMKWHKFLVYFALWAGALLSISTGVQAFLGTHYGEYKDEVYRLMPNLKTVDLVYFIACICCALFTFTTAVFLLKYKSAGPKMLIAMYGLNCAVEIIYIIAASSVVSSFNSAVDLSDMRRQAITAIISAIFMMIVNKIYYGKRDYLFDK